MNTSAVWLDDRLVAPDDAMLPFDDHAITVGDGVFESIKLADGATFALTRHLGRLARSAAALRLKCPPDELLRDAVTAVAHSATAAGMDSAIVRITLTAGRGPLGSPRERNSGRLIVAARPALVRTEPTAVILAPWPRNERGALAGVKSTSYAENVLALCLAEDAGAGEALFANTVGNLCEGTGSNVFVGFGDRLVTPPASAGCLEGVTRGLLLEAGVGQEADIPTGSLEDATEMFLVSTGREVQPIAALDGRELPSAPGPLTVGARRVWVARHGPGSPTDP